MLIGVCLFLDNPFKSVYFQSSVLSLHITTEKTWGETASDNVIFNGRRDNKVAVSPSRPLNCSTAR